LPAKKPDNGKSTTFKVYKPKEISSSKKMKDCDKISQPSRNTSSKPK